MTRLRPDTPPDEALRAFRPRLVCYFRNRGAPPPDIDALCQEVFSRVSRWHQLTYVGPINHAVFAIARGVILDYANARFPRQAERHAAAALRADNPLDARDVPEVAKAAHIFVATLDEKAKHVFVAKRILRLPDAQIAAALGATARDVKRTHLTTLAQLHAYLAHILKTDHPAISLKGHRDADLDAAARWHALIEDGDARTQARFLRWRNSNRRRAAAWEAVKAMLDTVVLAVKAAPDFVNTIEEARENLEIFGRQRRASRAASQRQWLLAAGLLIPAAFGAHLWRASLPEIYRTATGQTQTIILKDGSQVALDAATRLEVRLKPNARTLTLTQGQARFNVAPDAARPFSVRAADQTITATGTRFDVDKLATTVTVTLLHGAVLVTTDPPADQPAAPKRSPVALQPGYRLIARAASAPTPPVVEAIDPAAAEGWRHNKLIFHGATLRDAAERVSRYTPNPITVADPVAADQRVTGIFQTGDQAAFLLAMTSVFNLTANKTADGVVELAATTAGASSLR